MTHWPAGRRSNRGARPSRALALILSRVKVRHRSYRLTSLTSLASEVREGLLSRRSGSPQREGGRQPAGPRSQPSAVTSLPPQEPRGPAGRCRTHRLTYSTSSGGCCCDLLVGPHGHAWAERGHLGAPSLVSPAARAAHRPGPSGLRDPRQPEDGPRVRPEPSSAQAARCQAERFRT